MSGFVYAIRGGDNWVKIGHSRTPESRLATVATHVPFEVWLVGYVAGTSADEYALHDKFSPWRLRGEWYYYTCDVKQFVDGLPQMNIAAPPGRALAWTGRKQEPLQRRPQRRYQNETRETIERMGGRKRVADVCQVTVNAVGNWIAENRIPPAKREILFAGAAQ